MLLEMSDRGETTASPQARIRDTHEETEAEEIEISQECTCVGKFRAFCTVGILFFINLLNYMDRFTIAGILVQIQNWFKIKDSNNLAGLLQTVFICSYMILAPVFGYLGDRFRRKYLMAAGIFVWSGTVFASTFMKPNSYWWFLALRGVVGIGEASYSTIAPTIIADLFTGSMRTKMLTIFYFAIPVGSGLGYVVGSTVAESFHQWQWGMRVTPMLGILGVFLCLLVVHEPQRGAIERGINPSVSASNVHMSTGYLEDLSFIFKTKSFIWLTLGFTCVSFVTGALAFWAPKFMYYALKSQGMNVKLESVSYKFGIITVVAGIVGVFLGAEVARRYRVYNGKADAIVCAVGLVSCTPFLYGALALARHNIIITYILVFIGEVLLCMNWAPVADMVLYVITPSRRSTAEAMQILVSHLFGDAGSPWLIGEVSDVIRGKDDSNGAHAISMEYALYITTFICILGGMCFVICSFYVVDDRKVAEEITQKTDKDDTSLLDSLPGECNGKENQDSDSDSGVEGNGRSTSSDEQFSHLIDNETDPLIVPVQVHNGAAQSGGRHPDATQTVLI